MNQCTGPRDCYESPKENFMSGFPIAMAYVPWQQFKTVYDPDKALSVGTIFPELDLPYTGKRGVRKS